MKEIDKSKTASFDVDPQRTFTPLCPNELPVAGGDEIAGELNAQASFAAFRVASRDAHSPKAVWIADEVHPQLSPIEGEPNADIRWNAHAIVGTEGFEFIPGIDEKAYDFQVFKGIEPNKHPYGACYHDLGDTESTGVIEWLKSRGVETVVVGGLALDFCVKKTVLQLASAGFEVVVNLAAVRAVNPEWGAAAIEEMKAAGAEFVASSSELRQAPKMKAF